MNKLEQAEHELAEIEKQRKALDVRESDLRTFIRIYRGLERAEENPPPQRPLIVKPRIRAEPVGEMSNKAIIVAAAESVLSDGRGHKSREILERALGNGAVIGAKDKELYVSGILSKDKARFKADRKKGWTLVKRYKKVEAGDVGASSSL